MGFALVQQAGELQLLEPEGSGFRAIGGDFGAADLFVLAFEHCRGRSVGSG